MTHREIGRYARVLHATGPAAGALSGAGRRVGGPPASSPPGDEDETVRKYFFEALATLLTLGSLVFFYECVRFLSRRDYVSAILLMFIGFAVIRVGAELARLALIDRS